VTLQTALPEADILFPVTVAVWRVRSVWSSIFRTRPGLLGQTTLWTVQAGVELDARGKKSTVEPLTVPKKGQVMALLRVWVPMKSAPLCVISQRTGTVAGWKLSARQVPDAETVLALL